MFSVDGDSLPSDYLSEVRNGFLCFAGVANSRTGAYISFHGLVMVDKQVRSLPLTPAFPCNDSELHNRRPLYAAFGAACHLLTVIEQDSMKLVRSSSLPILRSSRRFPDISSVLRISGSEAQNEQINFQIVERLTPDSGGRRFLYRATTPGPNSQDILVKFSRQYSIDLHAFCASKNHAPQLLGFRELPGGWIAIAMEYLLSAKPVLESTFLAEHGGRWMNEMDQVVEEFHAEGYVHGDLRPPNFIVDGERLVLVDFDWGGRETQATFPDAQLHQILRPNRLETRPTKQLDKFVLDYTKKNINSKMGNLGAPS
jgi:hypothetical protein